MNQLLIILVFISAISCAHICREDGIFPNNEDNTAYLECKDGVSFLRSCPLSQDGVSYLTFNGKECVFEERVPRQIVDPSCPMGTVYDYSSGTCRIPIDVQPNRQSPDIERYEMPAQDVTCPHGTTYDSSLGKCHGTEYADPIVEQGLAGSNVRYTCHSGYTYDTSMRKCRSVSYVDPIQTMEKQRDTYRYSCQPGYTYDQTIHKCRGLTYVDPIVSYTCPQGFHIDDSGTRCVRVTVIDPYVSTRCPGGYVWNRATGGCEPIAPVGRYRRNGRVETEDRENGAVIVDTWNERQWRWNRNPNGQRILPDVSGWLDRSHDYNRQRND